MPVPPVTVTAVPPETNHPPPAAPQIAAATPANKPDAPRPTNRARVGIETLAFHAAVAAGDMVSVEAYIALNEEKIRQSQAVHDEDDGLPYSRKEDTTTGFAALLVVPGPSSDPAGSSILSPLEVLDLCGRTPLHTACVEGQAEVVRVLLRAGADAGAFDSAG